MPPEEILVDPPKTDPEDTVCPSSELGLEDPPTIEEVDRGGLTEGET